MEGGPRLTGGRMYIGSPDSKAVRPTGHAIYLLAWLSLVAWSLISVAALAQDAQWESHIRAADSAYEHGDFRGALENGEKALSAAEVFGEKDERYIKTLVVLGLYNRRLRREGLAESYYERALRLYEETLGPNHEAVAIVLTNLAAIRLLQKRYREAEEYQRRTLSIFEQVNGPDDPNVGWTLRNLAHTYKWTGRTDEAELALKRARFICEKAGQTNSQDMASTVRQLGHLDFYQGRYADAEPLLQQALQYFEVQYGSNHKLVRDIQSTLADIERRQSGSTADPEKGASER